MKLSVIITNYNKSPMIQYLISYFNRKNRDDIEIICIDDNSNEIIENWGNIKIIKNNKNLGIGKVRQQGLDCSKGEYIVFIDGDDIPLENYLDEILKAIKTKADIYEFLAINYPWGNILDDPGMVWNKVYKRDFILTHKCKFPNWRGGEDILFNQKVYSYQPIVEKIPQILYIYNMMTEGLSHIGIL